MQLSVKLRHNRRGSDLCHRVDCGESRRGQALVLKNIFWPQERRSDLLFEHWKMGDDYPFCAKCNPHPNCYFTCKKCKPVVAPVKARAQGAQGVLPISVSQFFYKAK